MGGGMAGVAAAKVLCQQGGFNTRENHRWMGADGRLDCFYFFFVQVLWDERKHILVQKQVRVLKGELGEVFSVGSSSNIASFVEVDELELHGEHHLGASFVVFEHSNIQLYFGLNFSDFIS